MDSAVTDISRQRIGTLYPGIRPLAYQILQSMAGLSKPMNVVQAMRTMDEQWTIYKQGREFVHDNWIIMDRDHIVSNARPGLSFHNYGLGFDCAFQGMDPYLKGISPSQQEAFWLQYGSIVKAHGLHWGGDFRLKNGSQDKPHAELSYGLQIHECLELYSQGGLDCVWSHIDTIRGVPIGQDWK